MEFAKNDFYSIREYTAPRQMQTFMFGLYFASEQTKDIPHIEWFCLLFPPEAFFSLHVF